jgi:hypothetical protein
MSDTHEEGGGLDTYVQSRLRIPPPSGVEEKCPELEKLKKGGKFTKLLPHFTLPRAEEYMGNFLGCIKRNSAMTLRVQEPDKLVTAFYPVWFQMEPDETDRFHGIVVPETGPTNARQRDAAFIERNREHLRQSLLYHLPEVCDEETMTRIRVAHENAEQEGRTYLWSAALEQIYWGHDAPQATALMEEIVLLVRAKGENVSMWMARNLVLQRRLAALGTPLPGRFTLDLVIRQMTAAEERLFPNPPETLVAAYNIIQAMPRSSLPVFNGLAADRRDKLPVYARAKDESKQGPKKGKKGASPEAPQAKELVCYKCLQKGHKANKCPNPAAPQAAGGHTSQQPAPGQRKGKYKRPGGGRQTYQGSQGYVRAENKGGNNPLPYRRSARLQNMQNGPRCGQCQGAHNESDCPRKNGTAASSYHVVGGQPPGQDDEAGLVREALEEATLY